MLQLKCFRNPKYVPDFGKAFEHFLIHTGGKAILDGLQKKLNLNDDQVTSITFILSKTVCHTTDLFGTGKVGMQASRAVRFPQNYHATNEGLEI